MRSLVNAEFIHKYMSVAYASWNVGRHSILSSSGGCVFVCVCESECWGRVIMLLTCGWCGGTHTHIHSYDIEVFFYVVPLLLLGWRVPATFLTA